MGPTALALCQSEAEGDAERGADAGGEITGWGEGASGSEEQGVSGSEEEEGVVEAAEVAVVEEEEGGAGGGAGGGVGA